MTDAIPHSEPRDDIAYANTDRELWRDLEGNENKDAGDYYADSIHVTEQGGIGINVGGTVYVRTLREWHGLLEQFEAVLRAVEDNERGPDYGWTHPDEPAADLHHKIRVILGASSPASRPEDK